MIPRQYPASARLNQTGIADIQVVAENTSGNDLIMGDIHGNHDIFVRVFNSLNPNDRLFLVGDLADRGLNSREVINTIIEYQKKYPNQIYIAYGNHEDMAVKNISNLECALQKNTSNFLEFLRDLKNKQENENITKKQMSELINHYINDALRFDKAIHIHLKNGGDWLVELFIEEIMSNKIEVNLDDPAKLHKLIYNDESEIKKIRSFMSALPYIIYVEGSNPFIVVHADNPLSDEELKKRINEKNFILTEDERRQANWAKLTQIKQNKHRNAFSIITYVGHNRINPKNEFFVVRAETNTINLDSSIYICGISLIVNHTQGISYLELTERAKGSEIIIISPKLKENKLQQKILDIQANNKFKRNFIYVLNHDSLLFFDDDFQLEIEKVNWDDNNHPEIDELINKLKAGMKTFDCILELSTNHLQQLSKLTDDYPLYVLIEESKTILNKFLKSKKVISHNNISNTLDIVDKLASNQFTDTKTWLNSIIRSDEPIMLEEQKLEAPNSVVKNDSNTIILKKQMS